MSEERTASFIDKPFEFRSIFSLILTTLTIAVFFHAFGINMLPKVYRLFKSNRTPTEQESLEKVPGASRALRKYSSPLATVDEVDNSGMDRKSYRDAASVIEQNQISRYVDDIDMETTVRRTDSRPAPHWLDGPRDSTTLPDIIASTYSDYNEEADYAMKQMLAILETLSPIEDYVELFEKALTAIEFRLPFTMIMKENGKPDWKECRDKLMDDSIPDGDDENRGLSTAQITSVFDALPFLFDTVACYEQLEKFQDALSMLVMIALTGNAVIRRQCISAISILMERSLLSQEFMREGVLPGLFFIYQSGIGTFQSNDLRMECVQALCQIISYDTIHDRQWLFENFLPKFSQMLKDPTMHVRKSALHIFGNLGNMFGQKFTEVFLVPHLITLSCDMTWAVRKVACEIFVKVAECASKEVRVNILSPNFVRLLNDPNKWVSFIAYQQLGPFISLFANPDITGLEMVNGQVVCKEIGELPDVITDVSNATITSESESDEFGLLPAGTWMPEFDYNDDFEYKLALNEIAPRPATEAVSAIVKTPRRGERVMDSVISGINKMFSPFERSSPKSSAPKEVEKIAATFSSPAKRSPLSLHSAVSLMDKWNKRSNPNNPQRFPIFNSNTESSADSKSERTTEHDGGSGIAAKCNSTDDLTKLGLEDDVSSSNCTTTASPQKNTESLAETRTSSPRGRRIATNAWSKLDIRQKLFLRRLGALPPSSPKRSPRLSSSRSPSRSPTRSGRKKKGMVFDFSAPTEFRASNLLTPPAIDEQDELNTVEREKYMENNSPKFNDEIGNESDSDEEDNLDKSFVTDEEVEDTPLTMEIQSSKSESVSVSVHSSNHEPVSNEFSLTYWSSNYAIASIEDELKPFGSSSAFTNSPTSNSYLESRFDVMKTNTSPRARSSSFGSNGSPLAVSPRSNRKSNSASESPPKTADASCSTDSLVLLNTEEKEKLGILDIDTMSMDMSSGSSINGDARSVTGDARSVTSDTDYEFLQNAMSLQHVPSDLVESYMKVMGPISHSSGVIATGDASLCAEIYRHCAHNFPAVCYTLGRAAWPRLKQVFRKLALDEQARVRQSISYSIHEIANMLGTEITDEDLLPVFYDLRNDQNADVRSGILLHLYDFVKCLSPTKRDEMIFSLPQFFPIGAQPGNQAQNGDWRSRFELISQLSKLCSLYNIQDINLHMSGIALTLADDRVAEVRREAVMLVSTIVGALVAAEWEEIKKTRDIESGHVDVKNKKNKAQAYLSEQFVDDIVSSFAKTQKWTRRQTFCFICAQVLRDKQCDGVQFRYFFATPLQLLVQDKVPNVRLTSCEAMSMWRKTLIAMRAQEKRGQSPLSSPASEPSALRRDINLVSDMMVKLSNDSDIDAAYIAKKCQGLTDEQQPVDVEARTNRMREREELFFGDVILTDSKGSVVRMAGKELKQIIKPGPVLAQEIKDLEEQISREAPIQTFEEFEDEIMRETQLMSYVAPPEIVAVAVNISETEDNTEAVDMEIDEIEEAAPTQPTTQPMLQAAPTQPVTQPMLQPVTQAATRKDEETQVVEEETDIPMDPSPSSASTSTDQPITTSQNENESEA